MAERTLMPDRRIEYRPLAWLLPNPGNAKLHDTAGIGGSMGRFGVIDPIVVDDRTGWIVSGHGRTDTLRELQAAGEPPPEGVEDRSDDWYVPVLAGWASRDEDEALAATVALNRWTEKGGWDTGTLIDQLDRLAATDAGLAGVGFDSADLDDLLAQHQEANFRLPDDNSQEDDWELGDPDRQVRAIMLDLPLDDYRWATGMCARARGDYGADSNAALFLVLLEDDAERAGLRR